ncbi:hypothetical protein EAH77_18515 [Ewingella americana]|uniref:Uncharacterized protein n=1 Tax=Ewingella americana TaxID=41202 RepID=A0A502GA97_9GAMM|nr:hypothetical protein EAH77_18515 [Ewingella americana]
MAIRGRLPRPAFKIKVKTVGSPPTLAQRVLNETLWNPAFFCCCNTAAALVTMAVFQVSLL